jgi:hydrogenase maturation protease
MKRSIHSYLIIGYGNTLRSDDGVGYLIAETIATWNLPQVKAIARHQLTPDLVEDIALMETVIFIDAIAREINTEAAIVTLPIPKKVRDNFSLHRLEPGTLLEMVRILYKRMPEAYQMLIPAIDFSFGENLSQLTKNSMAIALERLKNLVYGEVSTRW